MESMNQQTRCPKSFYFLTVIWKKSCTSTSNDGRNLIIQLAKIVGGGLEGVIVMDAPKCDWCSWASYAVASNRQNSCSLRDLSSEYM